MKLFSRQSCGAFFFFILAGTGIFSVPAFAYLDEVEPSDMTLSGYRPTYLLSGKDDWKLQLSFKARGIPEWPIYFGYTQLMLWEVFDDSAPFRDINYNPELFYRMNFRSDSGPRWLDLGVWEHESNGRDKADTRSWNKVYVRYQKVYVRDVDAGRRIEWNLKAWIPYGFDSENRDIGHYRGRAEGIISFTGVFGRFWENSSISLRTYLGGRHYLNPLEGGQEITVAGKIRDLKYLPRFMVQFFHGYGENMLDYRERKTILRGGIAF